MNIKSKVQFVLPSNFNWLSFRQDISKEFVTLGTLNINLKLKCTVYTNLSYHTYLSRFILYLFWSIQEIDWISYQKIKKRLNWQVNIFQKFRNLYLDAQLRFAWIYTRVNISYRFYNIYWYLNIRILIRILLKDVIVFLCCSYIYFPN